MNGLLTAMQHADSAFPSGSFAFSNGIEGLAAQGPRLERARLAAAVDSTIRHRWACADRVALVHAFRARDLDRVAAIDAALEASTIAEPLRTGSKRNGGALLAAHVRLGTDCAAAFRALIDAGHAHGHLAVVQGLVWRSLGISEPHAVAMSGYTTASGLVAAAVRLGQIGAIEAQAVLGNALLAIEEAAGEPIPAAEEIASFTPWLDVACARQAHAHVRLFSN
ncbi:MAG: urease accessory protein [Hyphomicrobiales bacterium]